MNKITTHGGPGRNQGRPTEPGYEKVSKVRFLTKAEEARIKAAKAILTPRKKVEIWLAWLDEQGEPGK